MLYTSGGAYGSPNYLRRIMEEQGIDPLAIQASGDEEEIIKNILTQAQRGQPMPQPRYDIAPMAMNTMRFESGPDAGKVTSLDFTGARAQPRRASAGAMGNAGGGAGWWDELAQPGGGAQRPDRLSMDELGPQPRQLKVLGVGGNGTTSQLGAEEVTGPIALDRTQAPIDIPGVGRAIRGKDGKAYVLGPDGQPTAKVILGYDREGSQRANKLNLERRRGEADIEQTRAQTAQIGAPNFQLTPEGDVFNPKTGAITAQGVQPGKEARTQRTAAYTSGLKELQKDDAQVAAASTMEQAYQEWAALNERVTTGRVMGKVPAIGDPDRQRLQQLESFLAVNNFKAGQGAISNFERGLIKGAGPSVNNDKEANQDIVRIGLGGVQNLRDRANFRETYLQQKGNLLGADLAWQQYLDANPRYVRDEQTGRIVDNAKRVEWQAHFSGGGAARPSAPSGAYSAPAGAVAYLKANPATRAQFDAKYGAGAAARVLGQ